MSNSVYAVITVARQVEGEYVFIKTEKAFRQAAPADALLQKLKKEFTTPDGKVKVINVATPQGDAECFCEVGAFELELEE
jgi:hypothetical protein